MGFEGVVDDDDALSRGESVVTLRMRMRAVRASPLAHQGPTMDKITGTVIGSTLCIQYENFIMVQYNRDIERNT